MRLGFLALVRGAGGTLHDAARLVRQALDHAGDQPVAALAHRVLGALLYEWDDLAEAETHLEQARGMARMIGNADLEVGILRQLAQLKQAQAQPAAALTLLNEVHELAARRQMPPFALAVNAACHTAIALAQHDLDSAQFWAEQVSEAADVSPFYPRLNLTPARLLLAQGENARAAAELAERHAAAQAAGWQWGALEAQALQALAASRQEEALAYTRLCLSAAQREGFVRLFLDKGPRMLGYCALLESDPEVGAYVRVLLARAATPVRQTAVTPSPSPPRRHRWLIRSASASWNSWRSWRGAGPTPRSRARCLSR